MITIGKISDKISLEKNNKYLLYMNSNNLKDSGTLISENKNPKHIFFDTSNLTDFTPSGIKKSNVKETESFIDNIKFYTCNTNAQTYLCFRCVDECVSCIDCNANCQNSTTCTDCRLCIDCNANCQNSTNCSGCNSCDSCTGKYGCKTCDSKCDSCNNCTGCNTCVDCHNCRSPTISCSVK